jgi:hydroxylamine reductase
VLLTLLHLGVKGIRIGPVPPAFITPNVFKILQEKFDLKLIESEPPKELVELAAV